MKKVTLLLGVMGLVSGLSYGHSGGLDKNGGHRDHKNGGYHKH
ncbi:MAG: YHYH domain-containing protein [Verrucomicrobiaceae bacterium]|nr:MAG: YHYH domain-containing protein [Verrucomicrobiaceae bacterium]